MSETRERDNGVRIVQGLVGVIMLAACGTTFALHWDEEASTGLEVANVMLNSVVAVIGAGFVADAALRKNELK